MRWAAFSAWVASLQIVGESHGNSANTHNALWKKSWQILDFLKLSDNTVQIEPLEYIDIAFVQADIIIPYL